MGRLDEAVDAYLKLLDLRPNDLAVLQNLISLYQQMGQYRQALDIALQTQALLPPDQQANLDPVIEQLRQELEGK